MPHRLAQKEVVALNAGFLNLVRTHSLRFGAKLSHLLDAPIEIQRRLCDVHTDKLNHFCAESRFMFFHPCKMVCCTEGDNISSGRVLPRNGNYYREHAPMDELSIQMCELSTAYHVSASIIAKIMPQVCVDTFGVRWSCIPSLQDLSHYQIAERCYTHGVRFKPRVPLDFLLHEDVEQGISSFIATMTASFTRATQRGVA